MSFIELLYARKGDGNSIRSIFSAFGVTRWSNLSKQDMCGLEISGRKSWTT